MPLTKYTNTPDDELVVHAYTQPADDELALELAVRLEHTLEEVERMLNGDESAQQRLQRILDGCNARG